ncbi:hypothetical protein DO109_22940 [Salmonella enterica]|nr:hypothetical protein [Salmonella enterica]
MPSFFGFSGRGIVTAKAVTLSESSLRCGASVASLLPCPHGHKKNVIYIKKELQIPQYEVLYLYREGKCPNNQQPIQGGS